MTEVSIRLRARLGSLDLDVSLDGDERPIALIGPNGSGKTTVLRMVAGGLTPMEGTVEVRGTVLFDRNKGVHVPLEERRVGYVPQGFGLFPHLSVIDNVAFGLAVGKAKQPRTARHEAARRVLEKLDCAHLGARLPETLSGGEKQRVALARALLVEPEILLLDEPLSALDVGTRRTVRTYLAEQLRLVRRPSVVVTHDVRDVVALAASVYVLEAGRVVQRGTLDELREKPVNEFVAEFVDGAI